MLEAHPSASSDDFSADEFYVEVGEVLEKTLVSQPRRQDLRCKLLEIYAASGRRQAFTATARDYRRLLDQGAGGDWEHIAELGRALLLDVPDPAHDNDQQTNKDEAAAAGGSYDQRFGFAAAETDLSGHLDRLNADYQRSRSAAKFLQEVDADMATLNGRMPSTLYPAQRLAARNGGAKIYLVREEPQDANSRKLANALGQARVAHERGCQRLVTGSVSGQHGMATAAAAVHLNLACTVHMRRDDAERNRGRAAAIKRLGAELRYLPASKEAQPRAHSGPFATALNDVRLAASEHWLSDPKTTQLVNGLAAGPDPFPAMLRDFQAGNGRTVRRHVVMNENALPNAIVADLDAGLEAFELFLPFLAYQSTRLLAVPDARPQKPRVSHDPAPRRGQYRNGQTDAAERMLRAQGFPSTQREHAWLRATNRVNYLRDTPNETAQAEAAEQLARTEGLLVTTRCRGALAVAMDEAARMGREDSVVVLLNTGLELETDLNTGTDLNLEE